ncbi:unnamed protein product [Paramecium pentaurelia]|uniref:Casein kinase I n=1 Tax=Paramecium pentaurelia TaxID=43138 RepID=A0A8S1T0X4_9CILI|nr:unnamed protein product [Paramecium pentaurelia]
MELTFAQKYRFTLDKRIGLGAFGQIYLGNNIKTGEEMAIKLENVSNKHSQLLHEAKIYRILLLDGPVPGFPNLHWFGQEGDFNVLVLDILGPSLEDLFNYHGRKFSLKSVLMLADQLLTRISYLHSKDFIHRDIKPENFLIGLNKKADNIYMIDFGLTKRYRYQRTETHIQYGEQNQLVGTCRFSSINAHLGIEQSRRDDLESIGYMLIYFLRGSLPWSGIKTETKIAKYEKVGECKIATPIDKLCEGFPGIKSIQIQRNLLNILITQKVQNLKKYLIMFGLKDFLRIYFIKKDIFGIMCLIGLKKLNEYQFIRKIINLIIQYLNFQVNDLQNYIIYKLLTCQMNQKLNESAQYGKNTIPKYEDWQQFRVNFFRNKSSEIKNDNFQQYFNLMDMDTIDQNSNSIYQKQQKKQEKILTYIIEYQQQQNLNNKLIYQLKRKNEEFDKNHKQLINNQIQEELFIEQPLREKNIIQNLLSIFNSFYNGDSSQILLQNSDIVPEELRVYIQRAIQQFNFNHEKKKENNLRLTYIGITKEYNLNKDIMQEKDFDSFQNFSIMIQDENKFQNQIDKELKSLIQQDQYYLKINFSNKITNQIQLLYRYFLKNKIKKFQPKIIVLLIEINDDFDFAAFFFQKLISQLEKISQHSLLIIPLLTSFTPYSYEKYLKSTLLISNSFYDYRFKRKNKSHYQCEDISAQDYNDYIKYFAQTQKEEKFFFSQFLALKVRQNQFKNNYMEIETEQQKQILHFAAKPILQNEDDNDNNKNKAQDFEYNLLGILNSNNKIELVKLYENETKQPIRISEVQYFISYDSDQKSFIICIVKNNHLFYQQCNFNKEQEKQIEDSIYLNQYPYFQNISDKQKSSYLLLGFYFYQFNVQFSKENQMQKKIGSNFKYYVQIYKYDINAIREPQYYNNSENEQNYYEALINFTISPRQNNSFILLGGTYQSLVKNDEYEFNISSYAITVEINEKEKNKLKIIKNVGKLKCYENSICQKINDQYMLYFESQTKYQAISFQSQIQRISIFGYEQIVKFDNCQIQNQMNFDFYQQKKKLFKSNQLNKIILEQNKKKLEFTVIVQELVQDNVKIVDQQDIIDVKELAKQVQLQVHQFRFIYDLISMKVDIKVESSHFFIQQIEKSNSLRNACLYINWLEDRNNQYIFHYNGIQNLYLLYFNDKPKAKIRKFIFEDPIDKEDNLDFDEVILNDLDNEQLWIVRKVNHQDYISLDIFESDWINLQDAKDSLEDSITKVPMNMIYRIEQIKEDFCLIGLEVKWQKEQGQRCPYLIVCTSTIIYEISIKQIRKIKWDYILRYKLNTWEKEPLQFQQSPIHRSRQVQFNVNMQIPTIVASLENGDLLLFYSYCNVKKESDQKFELEIKYLILKDYKELNNDQIDIEEENREFQYKNIKYNSQMEVNIAKINTVIIQNNEFEFSVIVEESDGQLYKIYSGDQSKDKKQFLTIMKECVILSDAAFLKNQSLIINQNQDRVYHLK